MNLYAVSNILALFSGLGINTCVKFEKACFFGMPMCVFFLCVFFIFLCVFFLKCVCFFPAICVFFGNPEEKHKGVLNLCFFWIWIGFHAEMSRNWCFCMHAEPGIGQWTSSFLGKYQKVQKVLYVAPNRHAVPLGRKNMVCMRIFTFWLQNLHVYAIYAANPLLWLRPMHYADLLRIAQRCRSNNAAVKRY